MTEQAIANGRNLYYEGQHGAEDAADTAQRLALVAERDSLRDALRIAREGYASEAATGLPVLPAWRERVLTLIDDALTA